MPLVTVTLMKGKSKDVKKSILDIVHASLVAAFKVPDDDRNQRILEVEEDNFEIPPGKSDNFMTIEMTVFPGRSLEAKRTLYKKIVSGLGGLDISGNDILIVLNEPPLSNWGVQGGCPASEADLGFALEV